MTREACSGAAGERRHEFGGVRAVALAVLVGRAMILTLARSHATPICRATEPEL